MKVSGLVRLAAMAACGCVMVASAQEKGMWRAMSTTARGITGDVAFTDIRMSINFSTYTIAQIRTLEPAELSAVFNLPANAPGSGNLYRTEIPGDKRFLHKNTLCGSEDVQWVVTYVNGKNLQLAMFSGNDMPKMTAEAVANTTSLCGTYGYTR